MLGRFSIGMVLVTILAAASWHFVNDRSATVHLITVDLGPVEKSLKVVGKLRSRKEVTVEASTTARVTKVLADEGRWVRTGDLLATLDDEDIKLRTLLTKRPHGRTHAGARRPSEARAGPSAQGARHGGGLTMDTPIFSPQFAPLLAVIRQGDLAVMCLLPGRKAVPLTIGAKGCPVLVIVGDDPPDAPAAGPEGFDQETLAAALTGCRGVMVYAAGEEARFYEFAALMAGVFGRFAVIETQSCREFAWLKALKTLAPHAVPLIVTADLGKYRDGGRA